MQNGYSCLESSWRGDYNVDYILIDIKWGKWLLVLWIVLSCLYDLFQANFSEFVNCLLDLLLRPYQVLEPAAENDEYGRDRLKFDEKFND